MAVTRYDDFGDVDPNGEYMKNSRGELVPYKAAAPNKPKPKQDLASQAGAEEKEDIRLRDTADRPATHFRTGKEVKQKKQLVQTADQMTIETARMLKESMDRDPNLRRRFDTVYMKVGNLNPSDFIYLRAAGSPAAEAPVSLPAYQERYGEAAPGAGVTKMFPETTRAGMRGAGLPTQVGAGVADLLTMAPRAAITGGTNLANMVSRFAVGENLAPQMEMEYSRPPERATFGQELLSGIQGDPAVMPSMAFGGAVSRVPKIASALRSASLAGRMAGGAAVGAGEGLASGAMHTFLDDAPLSAGLSEGGVGAVLGAGLPVAGAVAGGALRRGKDLLGKFRGSKIGEALEEGISPSMARIDRGRTGDAPVVNQGSTKEVTEFAQTPYAEGGLGLAQDEIPLAGFKDGPTVATRAERQLAGGPQGERTLERFQKSWDAVEAKVDDLVRGTTPEGDLLPPPVRSEAMDELRAGVRQAQDDLFESARESFGALEPGQRQLVDEYLQRPALIDVVTRAEPTSDIYDLALLRLLKSDPRLYGSVSATASDYKMVGGFTLMDDLAKRAEKDPRMAALLDGVERDVMAGAPLEDALVRLGKEHPRAIVDLFDTEIVGPGGMQIGVFDRMRNTNKLLDDLIESATKDASATVIPEQANELASLMNILTDAQDKLNKVALISQSMNPGGPVKVDIKMSRELDFEFLNTLRRMIGEYAFDPARVAKPLPSRTDKALRQTYHKLRDDMLNVLEQSGQKELANKIRQNNEIVSAFLESKTGVGRALRDDLMGSEKAFNNIFTDQKRTDQFLVLAKDQPAALDLARRTYLNDFILQRGADGEINAGRTLNKLRKNEAVAKKLFNGDERGRSLLDSFTKTMRFGNRIGQPFFPGSAGQTQFGLGRELAARVTQPVARQLTEMSRGRQLAEIAGMQTPEVFGTQRFARQAARSSLRGPQLGSYWQEQEIPLYDFVEEKR